MSTQNGTCDIGNHVQHGVLTLIFLRHHHMQWPRMQCRLLCLLNSILPHRKALFLPRLTLSCMMLPHGLRLHLDSDFIIHSCAKDCSLGIISRVGHPHFTSKSPSQESECRRRPQSRLVMRSGGLKEGRDSCYIDSSLWPRERALLNKA